MRAAYVRVMDLLYLLCMVLAAGSIVAMALIIAWSVYTRYVLVEGSFWAEPVAITLAVQMTFYGAAACYRARAHISIDTFARMLPAGLPRRAADLVVDILVLVLGLAMVWYGWGLMTTTWNQVYPEFQFLRVGGVYSAVPFSGIVLTLFVLERIAAPRRSGPARPGEVA